MRLPPTLLKYAPKTEMTQLDAARQPEKKKFFALLHPQSSLAALALAAIDQIYRRRLRALTCMTIGTLRSRLAGQESQGRVAFMCAS